MSIEKGGGGLLSDFGCSGGKHSKYCPIWLKIEIYTPHYICYPQN